MGRWRLLPLALAGGLVAGAVGCELQDVTLVDVTDIVVAEVYVTIGDSAADNRVRAFVHGTPTGGLEGTATFDDATVQVLRDDGLTLDLSVGALEDCVTSHPDGSGGTCFVADSAGEAALGPGDMLALADRAGRRRRHRRRHPRARRLRPRRRGGRPAGSRRTRR